MLRTLLTILAVTSLPQWSLASPEPVPFPTLQKACSHNRYRMTRYRDRNPNSLTLVYFLLSATQVYEINLICGDQLRLSFTLKNFERGTTQILELEQSSLKWDARNEVLSIKSILKPDRTHLTLYIRPVIDQVSARDCDGCYSERESRDGVTQENWYDAQGRQIPEPPIVNFGKKVVFTKMLMSPEVTFALHSRAPIRKEVENLAIQSLSDLNRMHDFPTDENFLGATRIEGLRNNLNFAAANFLFRGDFNVTNVSIENTATFYRAQTIPYNAFFSELSRISL